MGIVSWGARSSIFLILFLDFLFSFSKDPVQDQKNFRDSTVFGPRTFAENSALVSEKKPYFAIVGSPPLSEVTVITQNLTVRLDEEGNANISEDAVDNDSDSPHLPLNFKTSKTAFTCSDIGPNEVVLTVTDAAGNSSTGNAIVTIIDDLAPDIITQDITVHLDTSGQATISPEQINIGSTDNCGIKDIRLDVFSFDCNDIGENTVTLNVEDHHGNTNSAKATVTIEDSTAPVALAQDITVSLDDSGNVNITPEQLNNGSSDNCGIKDIRLDVSSFNCNDIGENTVTLTVEDHYENTNSAKATVTIEDTTAPEIIFQDITVQLDATGKAIISASDIDNDTHDACGIAALNLNVTEFGCSDIGPNTVILTATDVNGNDSSAEVTVTVEDRVAPVVNTQNITVELNANGKATITTSDIDDGSHDACGIANLSLNITTFDCSDLGENTVTLTGTDVNGNVASKEAVVTVEDNLPPQISQLPEIIWGCAYTLTPPIAYDNCGGEITGTTESMTISESGIIVWTFQDGNGNKSEAKQKITINPVSVTITGKNIDCYGDLTGEAVAQVTGGVGPFTYSWSNNSLDPKIEGVGQGTYSVIVTDANGCTATKEITISQPEELIIQPLTIKPISCHGGSNGSITINSVTGGNGGYRFSLNGSAFTTNKTYSGLAAGDYEVKVRDSKGCIDIETVSITEPEELSISQATINHVTCYGGNNGSIIAGTVSGGVPPYKYSLDNTNFQVNGSFSGISANRYSIFVVDANGCAIETSVLIDEPDPLTAEVMVNNITCNGGEDGKIYLTGLSGGSNNFEFSIDGGQTWSAAPYESTALKPGTYSVLIRDANSVTCIKDLGHVTITQPENLEGHVTTTSTTEYGTPTGTATAQISGGSPGYTYLWEKLENNTWVTINQQTKTAINLLAGDYQVTVSDSNSCSVTLPFKIIDKISGNISIFSTCADSNNDIRASYFSLLENSIKGGTGDWKDYMYQWEFGSNANNGAVEIIRFEGGPKARYGEGPYIGDFDDEFVVPYNSAGPQIIKLTIIDNGTTPPTEETIEFSHTVNPCFTECGSAKDIGVDITSFFIGKEIKKNGNNTEVVEVRDCGENTDDLFLFIELTSTSKTDRISVELEFTINGVPYSADIIKNINLNNLTHLQLFPIGTGEDEIPWNCGDDLAIIFGSFDWDKPGNGDAKPHCFGINFEFPVPTPLKASLNTENILCFGEETGAIHVTVSGGSGRHSMSAKNLQNNVTYEPTLNSTSFHSLPAGTYEVTVSDEGGSDPISLTAEIFQPAPLTAEVSVTQPQCYFDPATGEIMLGKAWISATGGVGDYTYLWNNIEGSSTAEVNLPPGDYTVTVTDKNNCSVTIPVEVLEPIKLTVPNAGQDQTLGCGFKSTILNANHVEYGVGTWSVIQSEPTNAPYQIGDVNNPRTQFTSNGGTFVLHWSIANEDGTCSEADSVNIKFEGDCETLDFDGVDDYVFVGDYYDCSTSDFTLEAWVKPEIETGSRTILSKGNWRKPEEGGYELLINNGSPTFRWNGNSVIASNSQKIKSDRWYHIGVVVSQTRVDLYVDGISVGNQSLKNFPREVDHPFIIGAFFDAQKPEVPNNHFKGWIEEVRIWSTALTVDQLRFMMNQRIEKNGTYVKGEILPMNVPGGLQWSSLAGYYRLYAKEDLITNGTTADLSTNRKDGYLKNITSWQVNSAPLPYLSESTGNWDSKETWDEKYNTSERKWWTYPNDQGINGQPIDWNIAFQYHDINSGERDITVLALLLETGKLNMEGSNEKYITGNSPASIPGTGNGLTITHYLKLDGIIDLNGESQLVQSEGSILTGSGRLEKDQQGTASSYNYNYWTSPVSTSHTPRNSGYTISEVMKDGTNPNEFGSISFNYQYHFADGPKSTPIKISTYWLNKFFGESGKYSQWRHVGQDGYMKAGEGFSMKGSSGHSKIEELQNYTFTGFPNNDIIKLSIGKDQGYLIGNPYPSAIDADKFILDNIHASGGTNTHNIFNGTLYFWDHFSGQTHYLQEYIGGYATYNLSGGVRAIANDNRINNEKPDGQFREGEKIPQQFIPVGQAFFVNTTLDDAIKSSNLPVTIHGGDIIFRNSQRVFMKENAASSVFHSQEPAGRKEKQDVDKRKKIRLKFHSPTGYHRQLLVTADTRATNNFDLGFDAILNETVAEDMYWFFNDAKFVIQGVPHLNKDQILPLGIRIRKNAEFRIRIDDLENIPEDMEIYLRDKQLKVLHDLRDSEYRSTAEPGTLNDRFELVFQGETPDPEIPEEGEEDGEDEEDNEDGNGGDGGKPDGGQGGGGPDPDNGEIVSPKGLDVFYIQEDREILIRNPHLIDLNNAFLNNTLGQRIQEYKAIPEALESRLPVRDFGAGVYIITINSEKGPIIKKIIIE